MVYNELKMELGFRADIIVENKVIIELKSVETILDVHKKQLLTYLKLTNLKLGIPVNFDAALIKDGITKIVNNLRWATTKFFSQSRKARNEKEWVDRFFLCEHCAVARTVF